MCMQHYPPNAPIDPFAESIATTPSPVDSIPPIDPSATPVYLATSDFIKNSILDKNQIS